MNIHAEHPTIERYTLCGVTHEGNENLPAQMATVNQEVTCRDCCVVIDFCRRFQYGYVQISR